MLSTRIVSAIVAILIIVPVLIWGGVHGVAVLVGFLTSLGVWELANKLTAARTSPSRELIVGLNVVTVAALSYFPLGAVPAVVVAVPLIILLIHLFLFNVVKDTIDSLTQSTFIIAYVTIPLSHAILLERLRNGPAWIFFVLVVTCLGDAGAYFAGKYVGRHRFSSNVSPNKTLEGLFGGVVGNVAGMLIMKLFCWELASLWLFLQITLLLAVLGPLGDLTASAIKRKLSIKDFGSIMPGHGGLLDRADSLIPSLPAVYYFVALSVPTVSS
jgi:phosphatidate cytidylyltransferase